MILDSSPFLGGKLKQQIKVFTKVIKIEILDCIFLVFQSLIIVIDPVSRYSSKCCLSGGTLCDEPPGGAEAGRDQAPEAPSHQAATPLVEGALGPETGVGVPVVQNVPDVHGHVEAAATPRSQRVRADLSLIVASQPNVNGEWALRSRWKVLRVSGQRTNGLLTVIIGCQCPSSGAGRGGEAARP